MRLTYEIPVAIYTYKKTLSYLNFRFNVFDGIGSLHLQSDSFSSKGLDEDLHGELYQLLALLTLPNSRLKQVGLAAPISSNSSAGANTAFDWLMFNLLYSDWLAQRSSLEGSVNVIRGFFLHFLCFTMYVFALLTT
jgi:hypothetical protein